MKTDYGMTRPLPQFGVEQSLARDLPNEGPSYSLMFTPEGRLWLTFFPEPNADEDADSHAGIVDAANFLQMASVTTTVHPELLKNDSETHNSPIVPYSVVIKSGTFSAYFPWKGYSEQSPRALAEAFMVSIAKKIFRELRYGENGGLLRVYKELGIWKEPASFSEVQNIHKKWLRLQQKNQGIPEVVSQNDVNSEALTLSDKRMVDTQETAQESTFTAKETEKAAAFVASMNQQMVELLTQLGIRPDALTAQMEHSPHGATIDKVLAADIAALRKYVSPELKRSWLKSAAITGFGLFIANGFAYWSTKLLEQTPLVSSELAPAAYMMLLIFAWSTVTGFIILFDDEEQQLQLREKQKLTLNLFSDVVDKNYRGTSMSPIALGQLLTSSLRVSFLDTVQENDATKRSVYRELQTLLISADAKILKPLELATNVIAQHPDLLKQLKSYELEKLISLAMKPLLNLIAEVNQQELLSGNTNLAAENRASLFSIASVLEMMHQVVMQKNPGSQLQLEVTVIDVYGPQRILLSDFVNNLKNVYPMVEADQHQAYKDFSRLAVEPQEEFSKSYLDDFHSMRKAQ